MVPAMFPEREQSYHSTTPPIALENSARNLVDLGTSSAVRTEVTCGSLVMVFPFQNQAAAG